MLLILCPFYSITTLFYRPLACENFHNRILTGGFQSKDMYNYYLYLCVNVIYINIVFVLDVVVFLFVVKSSVTILFFRLL